MAAKVLGRTTATRRQDLLAMPNYYHPKFFCLDQDLILPGNAWIIVQLKNDPNLSVVGFTLQRLLHRRIMEMPWVTVNLAVGNMHEQEGKKWTAGTTLDHIVNQPGIASCLLFMPTTATDQSLHSLDFM